MRPQVQIHPQPQVRTNKQAPPLAQENRLKIQVRHQVVPDKAEVQTLSKACEGHSQTVGKDTKCCRTVADATSRSASRISDPGILRLCKTGLGNYTSGGGMQASLRCEQSYRQQDSTRPGYQSSSRSSTHAVNAELGRNEETTSGLLSTSRQNSSTQENATYFFTKDLSVIAISRALRFSGGAEISDKEIESIMTAYVERYQDMVHLILSTAMASLG